MAPVADGDFHLFLAHAWASGQDQMQVVKQRLTEMLPEVKVCLDVDTLHRTHGKGAELVVRCEHFLVFCSGGFFSSPNCIRELICAVLQRKPIIVLMEPDRRHGRLTKAAAKDGLHEAVTRYAEWGLIDEARRGDSALGRVVAGPLQRWGFATLPGPDELYDAIFATEPIVWDRVVHFQDVSLRLLAERLLPHSLQGATYLQDELTRQKIVMPLPRRGRRFHLYCSVHNAGARELTSEMSASLGQMLELTSDFGELRACERVLLYVNGQTWRSGAASEALAHEVGAAKAAGVELLLAHETLGEDSQEARHGVEFEEVERATPPHLLAQGVYDTIAIGLKAGAWRAVSMRMLAHELIVTQAEDATLSLSSIARLVDRWRGWRRRAGLAAQTQPAPRRPLSVFLRSLRTSRPLARTHWSGSGGCSAPLVLHSTCSEPAGDASPCKPLSYGDLSSEGGLDRHACARGVVAAAPAGAQVAMELVRTEGPAT